MYSVSSMFLEKAKSTRVYEAVDSSQKTSRRRLAAITKEVLDFLPKKKLKYK